MTDETTKLDLQPFRLALAEANGAEQAAASRWAVEALVAEIAKLRDDARDLTARLADETRDRQMIAEHALDVLTDLIGETP